MHTDFNKSQLTFQAVLANTGNTNGKIIVEVKRKISSWWRHQMETFSALLAICAGNSPVPAEFPAQRPVTRNFDDFFDLRLNKRLSKQSWGWRFETLSRPLWRHCIFFHISQNRNHCLLIAIWRRDTSGQNSPYTYLPVIGKVRVH